MKKVLLGVSILFLSVLSFAQADLLKSQSPCTKDSQCTVGHCTQGKCALANGSYCTVSHDCLSKKCDLKNGSPTKNQCVDK